jgi:uncharacterized protein (TIGR00730 family)
VRRVCVFCGSNRGADPSYSLAARELGLELVRRGLGLVYGGASVGLMGVVADTVVDQGGEAIGIIPRSLRRREVAHQGLTELHEVESMHDRKALMADLSGGFVTLPGGYGTLDELAEALSWAQLGLHSKPVGLLDVGGFFSPLLAFFDRAVADGFLQQAHRDLLLVSRHPAALLDLMAAHQAVRDDP